MPPTYVVAAYSDAGLVQHSEPHLGSRFPDFEHAERMQMTVDDDDDDDTQPAVGTAAAVDMRAVVVVEEPDALVRMVPQQQDFRFEAVLDLARRSVPAMEEQSQQS